MHPDIQTTVQEKTAEISQLAALPDQDLPWDDQECKEIGTEWHRIRTLYPDKCANYTITNKMYEYLKTLNNPTLTHEVITGQRRMTPSTKGKYLYQSAKNHKHADLKGRTPGKKLLSTTLKEMMTIDITAKNQLTGKMETMSAMDHLAASILNQAIKKGNFRHANIILERVEGKVPETVNSNITMGIASVLKMISAQDEGHMIEHNDDMDEGEAE